MCVARVLPFLQDGVKALVEKGPKRITPFFIPYAITNMGGAMLAIEKGFMGPNYSISSACATGNFCILNSVDHIRNGEADLMLAGSPAGGARTRGRLRVREVSLFTFAHCMFARS